MSATQALLTSDLPSCRTVDPKITITQLCKPLETTWNGIEITASITTDEDEQECKDYNYVWSLSIDGPEIKCMIDHENFGRFKYTSFCDVRNIHATYSYMDWPSDGSRDTSKCTVGGTNLPIDVFQSVNNLDKCDMIVEIQAGKNPDNVEMWDNCHYFKVYSSEYAKHLALGSGLMLLVTSSQLF